MAPAQGAAKQAPPGEPEPPREIAPSRTESGRWPHQLSRQPLMRVSDVLSLVQKEFPALSPSKLRFLDTQGLVTPVRTSGGYRQYSPADVERLRYVLREQRDHYRPLTVILDRLVALDAGIEREAVALHSVEDAKSQWVSAGQLAAAAGVEPDLVASFASAGIIFEGMPGKFSRSDVSIVHGASVYLEAGGDLRALKVLRNAAVREADLARAIAAPIRSKGDAGAAQNQASELAEAAAAVFGQIVRAEVARG